VELILSVNDLCISLPAVALERHTDTFKVQTTSRETPSNFLSYGSYLSSYISAVINHFGYKIVNVKHSC